MMRLKIVLVLFVLASIVAGFFGCAKQAGSLLEGAMEESFEAWMKRYDPLAEKKESGIYMRFIERGNLEFIKPKPDTSWFLMDYTLHTLSGLIVSTRDELKSKLIGQWAVTTHWTDDLLRYYSNYREGYYKVCPGLRDAFQYLRQGDSVRIYIPGHLAYSRSMLENEAYGGDAGDGYYNKPVYFDIRVKELINDPVRWELSLVHDYVFKKWGQLPKDSVAKGYFMRVIGDVGGGDSIKRDSITKMWYADYFLDDHLQETNVKGIAQKTDFFGKNGITWSYEAKYLSGADYDNVEQKKDLSLAVFVTAFKHMKRGQTVEVIATSDWKFGNSGNSGAKPQILPYQPLKYKMRVLKRDEKTEEKDVDLSLLY